MLEFRHDKFRYYHGDADKTALDAKKCLFSITTIRGDLIFRQLQSVDSMSHDKNTQLNLLVMIYCFYKFLLIFYGQLEVECCYLNNP